jgi:hypothetical protein
MTKRSMWRFNAFDVPTLFGFLEGSSRRFRLKLVHQTLVLVFVAFQACSAQNPSHTATEMLNACALEAEAVALKNDAVILRAMASEAKAGGELLVIEKAPFVALANDQLGLLFKVTPNTAGLRGVYHAEKKSQFIRWRLGELPLWETVFVKGVKEPQRISSTRQAAVSHTAQATVDAATLAIRWKCDQPQFAASMEVRLLAGSALSQWSLRVDGTDKKVGLARVSFPMIRGAGRADESKSDFLAVPHKSGWLYYNPGRTADFFGDPNLQYACYYSDDAGLYMQADEGTGYTKQLAALADSGTVAMWFDYPVPDYGKIGGMFTARGVVGVFTGDWYDGSMVYRDWALRQKWTPKQTLDKRADIPEWIKRTSLTIRSSDGIATNELPRLRKIIEQYPTHANIHWYGWTAKDGDNQDLRRLPDLDTVQPQFDAVARELVKLGIYIGGLYHEPLLWATDSKAWKAYDGAAAATTDEDGQFRYARFGNFPLTVACQKHPNTQRVMVDTALKMVREHHAKGVYADLNGTFGGGICFAKTHPHPVLGGSWYADGQRELLNKMRAECRKHDPDFVVQVENFDERIQDAFDTYLIFQGLNPEYQVNIPMVQAVYGDRTLYYGAKSGGVQNPPLEAADLAQIFVWGGMIGRFWTSMFDPGREIEREHWLRLARYRDAALDYIVGARMMRPLHLKHEIPDDNPLSERFAIQHSVFGRADGRVAFLFATSRINKEWKFSYTIRPAAYGIPADGTWTLYRLKEDKSIEPVGAISGAMERTDTLQPREAAVFIAMPTGGKL